MNIHVPTSHRKEQALASLLRRLLRGHVLVPARGLGDEAVQHVPHRPAPPEFGDPGKREPGSSPKNKGTLFEAWTIFSGATKKSRKNNWCH